MRLTNETRDTNFDRFCPAGTAPPPLRQSIEMLKRNAPSRQQSGILFPRPPLPSPRALIPPSISKKRKSVPPTSDSKGCYDGRLRGRGPNSSPIFPSTAVHGSLAVGTLGHLSGLAAAVKSNIILSPALKASTAVVNQQSDRQQQHQQQWPSQRQQEQQQQQQQQQQQFFRKAVSKTAIKTGHLRLVEKGLPLNGSLSPCTTAAVPEPSRSSEGGDKTRTMTEGSIESVGVAATAGPTKRFKSRRGVRSSGKRNITGTAVAAVPRTENATEWRVPRTGTRIPSTNLNHALVTTSIDSQRIVDSETSTGGSVSSPVRCRVTSDGHGGDRNGLEGGENERGRSRNPAPANKSMAQGTARRDGNTTGASAVTDTAVGYTVKTAAERRAKGLRTRPRPEAFSASATTPKACPAGLVGGQKSEKLPPCPYPGHENVSWTCRACGGTSHHLTSRFAMEPLQRVHGFKVQRVPNDGDCFFSSIKAAIEQGDERCWESKDAVAKEATTGGITVAKMREWVAEETGEEQLAFYTLQAKANPEERWLDFVRPLHERMPSDEEDGGSESHEELSENGSQYTPPKATNKKKCVPRSGDSGRGGEKCIRTESKVDDEPPASEKRPGLLPMMTHFTAKVEPSDREARCLGRRRNEGMGTVAASLATVQKRPAKRVLACKAKSKACPPSFALEAGAGASSRRSTRLGFQVKAPGASVDQREGGHAEGAMGDEKEEGELKESQDEGLPVVESVDELRRFVQLEGSVVGHGRCMWADTFAHHVISRRLRLTILFIDMEREKSAWPYRVLARTVQDNGDDHGEGRGKGEKSERFVILKREPNHFVLLKTVPLPLEVGGAGAGGEGSSTTHTPKRGGQALFRRSELPDVVRRLWQIESQISRPPKEEEEQAAS